MDSQKLRIGQQSNSTIYNLENSEELTNSGIWYLLIQQLINCLQTGGATDVILKRHKGYMNQKDKNIALEDILAEISQLPKEVVDIPRLGQPCIYGSSVFPSVVWNKQEICLQLVIVLPEELTQFWNYTSEVRVQTLEAGNCLQSGIQIHSPLDVIRYHREMVSREPSGRYIKGDLIIGEKVGDLMLFVVRCDPNSHDFGYILVSNPMEQRQDWIIAGKTFTEFLRKCLSGEI